MQGAVVIARLLIACAFFVPLIADTKPARPSEICSDPLELAVYKSRFEDAAQAVAFCQAGSADAEVDRAYRKGYYEQELKFREVELSIYRWQITAANAVLYLVGLLTLSGIVFSGYQLWRVNRISKAPPAGVELELSLSRLRVQTSVIGAIVLFVSYAFLLVFTRDIYTIRKIEQAAGKSQGSTVSIERALPK